MTLNDLAYMHFLVQGYFVSDRLPKAGDETIIYNGYINRKGAFYILKENTANGTYRYYRGEENYVTYWGLREELTYKYYYEVF